MERIRGFSSIFDANRRGILEFRNFSFAEGLSVERVEHYLHILNKITDKMNAHALDSSGTSMSTSPKKMARALST